MGLFSFLRKKKDPVRPNNIDVSVLAVDMHGHFLPGLDDGSESMEQSIAMLKGLEDLGYKKVICTPHVMHGHFQNTTTQIKESLEELKKASKEAGIGLELDAAAEYYLDAEFMRRIEADDLLSFGNSDYRFVLFELSYFNEPMGLDDAVQKIKDKGFIPVLAHPERYPYYNAESYSQLKAKGLLLQVNLNSLDGLYAEAAKMNAQYLLENGLADFVGSDAHRIDHVERLHNSFKKECLHAYLESGGGMNSQLLE